MRLVALAIVACSCGARSELDGALPRDGSVVDATTHDSPFGFDATDGLLLVDAPNDTEPPDAQTPLPAIVAGDFSGACALQASGEVKCWLPYGSAILVSGFPSPVVGLAVGNGYRFARLEDNSIWAWGAGGDCVLGFGVVNDSRAAPTMVPALKHDVVSVATASGQALAVLGNGSVVAWGAGPNGYGKTGTACGPTAVIGLNAPAGNVAVSPGLSCAVLVDGTVQCWGQNTSGQLGIGSFTAEPALTAATAVVGIADAIAVTAGRTHACVLRSLGQVSCWGDDTYGQLGDGNTDTMSALPVHVALAEEAVMVNAAAYTTCAVLVSGSIVCWGANHSEGDLGNGGLPAVEKTPTPLTNLIANAVSVGQQLSFGCGLLADGHAKCWGGYNAFTDAGSQSPLDVPGLP